jgi:hypothetical protein
MFVNWANARYHYESGLLEPEFWAANRAGFERQISGTGPFSALLRRNWAGMRHAYSRSFAQMIDSMVAAAELP